MGMIGRGQDMENDQATWKGRLSTIYCGFDGEAATELYPCHSL